MAVKYKDAGPKIYQQAADLSGFKKNSGATQFFMGSLGVLRTRFLDEVGKITGNNLK
jgi:hypothetical protein